MSSTATHNLSREKIQQILASIGSQKVDQSDKIKAADYNWRQPHCFSNEQLKKLNSFAEKLALGCAEKFTKLYNTDFNVTIALISQHFADELIASAKNQGEYYLAFGSEPDSPFGLVGIPDKSAFVWATQLLGDTGAIEGSDRDLSQLEESLLFDITCGVIKAFSDSYENNELQPGSKIIKGRMPIEPEGTEELCKITFSVEKANSKNPSEGYFLIPCNELKAVVGQNVQIDKSSSGKTAAKAMLGYVHKLPVRITARLASTVFTLEEMMSLHVDDVLLLDKRLNEPVELIIEGQSVFCGRPAKSGGNYAVVITELCSTE